MPTAAATPNVPAEESIAYALAAADTSNFPAAETTQLRCRFAYSKKNLMAYKELFWNQHDNIPPNVIFMFENDLMYRMGVLFMCHFLVQKSLTILLSGTCCA